MASGSLTEQANHTRSAILLESSVVNHSEGERGWVHSHLHSTLQVLSTSDAIGMVRDVLLVNL